MKSIFLILTIQIFLASFLVAQDPTAVPTTSTGETRDNAWELGVHAGHFFSKGNIKFVPGYGGGIHIRRAMDHVFSLRLDLLYANARGEDNGNVRSFDTKWMSGSLQFLASLNNLKWNLGERKTNIYALGGFGLNNFDGETEISGTGTTSVSGNAAAHADLGAGIAFRINNRINFGIEHKATFILGKRGDLVDGIETFPMVAPDDRGAFRDVLNYTSIRLNINLGNLTTKSEPLYWVNPLEGVINDITRLKDTRVTLTDTDGDGVIDMMDDEENTPAGAPVNSKGVTLDSDGDRIADYQDSEPFSVPGYPVNSQGVAQMPDLQAEMRKYVDEKMRNFTPNPTPSAPSTNVSGLYLPSLYFPLGGYKVSEQQIGTLADIAQALKSNPSLRLTVTGFTDEKGSENANLLLSYNRAKSVIESLNSKFGIAKDRLVLQYKGEQEQLSQGYMQINRRVGFGVAGNETDMAPPASGK